ncbi:putative phytosulfokines 6 isoform X2 [Ziziphus jujuba]|uniref:Phytosulfokine n=1 Tax=Ziziphus jujuba TaxID=326968 RepID=A0A6P3ZFA4_ZIZJJ|nr:putative phytosulfokines 6 isoform X2 [Ziziphus jujuba]
MKQGALSTVLLLFLILIISSSKSSARFLTTKQGGEDQTLNEIIISGTSDLVELEDSESANLMGVEECKKEDDECLKRRIIAEAHLDYIYTQHHKP